MHKYNHKKIKPKIIFFSGAGLSAPSGISTFRDSDGLWENHKIEDICNEFSWKKNFEAVHSFYNQRRNQLAEVEPNIAHKTIANIIKKYGEENVINITQNVDDLFSRINCKAIQVHGELTKMECYACGNEWNIGYNSFDINKDRCPKCNSLKAVKPKIVFFGGQAPNYKKMFKSFDYGENPKTIIIVIGTLGNIIPINDIIKFSPAKKILCNMEPSQYIIEENFDKVYFESIESAIFKIEKDIEELWDN